MSRHPDQFADELRLIAGGLEGVAGALRECGDSVEAGADEFDRVVEERDELRAELARMWPVVEAALEALERGTVGDEGLRDHVRAYHEGGAL